MYGGVPLSRLVLPGPFPKDGCCVWTHAQVRILFLKILGASRNVNSPQKGHIPQHP